MRISEVEHEMKNYLSQVDSEISSLQAVMKSTFDNRVREVREIVQELHEVDSFDSLEAVESRLSSFEVDSISLIVQALKESCDRLISAEVELFTTELDNCLDSIVLAEESRSEFGGTGDSFQAGRPAPSQLVLRLRKFLDLAKTDGVSIELAKSKLNLATSIVATINATHQYRCVETGSADVPVHDIDRYELEDLGSIVDELSDLVSSLVETLEIEESNKAVVYAPNKAGVKRAVVKVKSSSSGSRAKRSPSKPGSEKIAAVIPLAEGEISAYEEDYFHHVGLYWSFLKSAKTEKNHEELRKFKGDLDRRRAEISIWRELGGYSGSRPILFSDSFRGVGPGRPPVRKGKSKGSEKRTPQSKPVEKRNGYSADEISAFLRELTHSRLNSSRGRSGKVGRKGNFNGKIFITSGLVNPRANKRKGDW